MMCNFTNSVSARDSAARAGQGCAYKSLSVFLLVSFAPCACRVLLAAPTIWSSWSVWPGWGQEPPLGTMPSLIHQAQDIYVALFMAPPGEAPCLPESMRATCERLQGFGGAVVQPWEDVS